MKRVGDDLQETSWEDALKIVAEKFKSSGSKTGVISSAGILNEDATALASLAADVIKTKNIDTTVSLCADADSIGSSDIVDIEKADLILLAGINPSQWERGLPALDASIRKRVSRGAKLIVINSEDIKAGEVAAVNLNGDEASIIAMIAKSLTSKSKKVDKDMESPLSGVSTTEDSDNASELLASSKSTIIFSSKSCLTKHLFSNNSR